MSFSSTDKIMEKKNSEKSRQLKQIKNEELLKSRPPQRVNILFIIFGVTNVETDLADQELEKILDQDNSSINCSFVLCPILKKSSKSVHNFLVILLTNQQKNFCL